jgi:hypothetical protein
MREIKAFPIAIIDEDYEGRHSAGRGMQQLAAAIEKEGFRIGGISYKDAQRLAEIFNNESCWLVRRRSTLFRRAMASASSGRYRRTSSIRNPSKRR